MRPFSGFPNASCIARVIATGAAVYAMANTLSCAPAVESTERAQGAPSPQAAPPPATPISPEEAVDPARLREFINALPQARAAWSDDRHRDGLRAAEVLILNRLTALGYQPELEPIDFLGSRTSGVDDRARADPSHEPWNNILVTLTGIGAPQEMLIVGAHFDAVPGSPGADDNATGTAALLELARVLKDRPMQRSVRLIFFNLEEVGLVGSRAHVERLKSAPNPPQVVGMVSLEMLGFYSDAPASQRSPLPKSDAFSPPTVGNFLALVGLARSQGFSRPLAAAMAEAAPSLPVLAVDFLPIAPPDFARSDHAPFIAAGMPAVMLTDTANFRNPHYHTPTDTIETIDLDRYTLAVRAVAGAIYRLAGPEGEPLPSLSTPPRPSANRDTGK